MRIAVISDTHIDKHSDKIEEFAEKHFKDADMIIHAGDYTSARVVNTLKKLKNFKGVWGNVDSDSVREILNEKEIIELEGYKIGIFHGHGTEKDTMERAYSIFKEDKVDIIIFGHSHKPIIYTRHKVLMLNPGSPTYKRIERWHSYIILELTREMIKAELRFFH
jgi:putative phosphoesterase